MYRNRLAVVVEDEEAGTRRALVDAADKHFLGWSHLSGARRNVTVWQQRRSSDWGGSAVFMDDTDTLAEEDRAVGSSPERSLLRSMCKCSREAQAGPAGAGQ